MSALDEVLSQADPKLGRSFAIGVLVAFIDFLAELKAYGKGYETLEDLLDDFQLQAETASRKRANTLIVRTPSGSLSIRPFYNKFERFMRAENKRFDYPSCAPHATQCWIDYTDWFAPLLKCSEAQAAAFRKRVIEFALETFPNAPRVTPRTAKEPSLFALLLEEFDFSSRPGEPPGAAFQGAVFGFIRADNPHLQVEIDKVKTGSKRLNRVGDVDAWDGDRLIISAEVKHYMFALNDIDDIAGFIHAIGLHGALGIVAALEFREDARDKLESAGIRARSMEDLLQAVSLWDPLKQRAAINAFLYYVVHREQKAALVERVLTFLADAKRRAAAVDP